MATFQDNAGRKWHVNITMAGVKDVKELTGVEIGRLLQDSMKPLDELLSDISTVIDVVFVLCKKQADADGVTDVMFGESLAGDAVVEACTAFVEAFADFCPSHQRKMILGLAAMTMQDHEQNLAAMNELISTAPDLASLELLVSNRGVSVSENLTGSPEDGSLPTGTPLASDGPQPLTQPAGSKGGQPMR